jgi:predicted nucleic acid-binding protein
VTGWLLDTDWLAHKVRPMFELRILPITEDIILKWLLLVEDGRKAGHTFSQPDLIIAATAFTMASPSSLAT